MGKPKNYINRVFGYLESQGAISQSNPIKSIDVPEGSQATFFSPLVELVLNSDCCSQAHDFLVYPLTFWNLLMQSL